MKSTPPENYREAFQPPEETARLKVLLDHLFDAGYLMINTCAATMSTPMTEADVDGLVAAMERGLAKIA